MQARAEQLLIAFYGATLPDIQATSSHPGAVPFTHQPSVALLREYCPWVLTKFVPANVGADGNCLFRAISFSLYGTERHHTQLRTLSAIEVLLNSALYDCDSSAFYAPFAADVWLNLPAFSVFALELVRDTAYSDMLSVLAVSTVVQKAVQTLWPLSLRPGEISPFTKLVVGHGVTSCKHPVYVLWTTSTCERSLSSAYKIDHFVPLVPVSTHASKSEIEVTDVDESNTSSDNPFVSVLLNGLESDEAHQTADSMDVGVSSAGEDSDVADVGLAGCDADSFCAGVDVDDGGNAVHTNAYCTLDGSQFLSVKTCIDIICDKTTECLRDIPDGPKSNVAFVIDNTRNVAREENHKRRQFADDCGAWKSVRQKERIFQRDSCKELFKRGEFLCMRKQAKGTLLYEPLTVQPNEHDVVVLHQYECALARDPSYKRRISWCDKQHFSAVVEYLGDFPAHVSQHGNAKCTGEYIRSRPSVLEHIKHDLKATSQKPKKVYTNLQLNANLERDKPRNLKQLQNCGVALRKECGTTGGFHSKMNVADEMQQLCSRVVDDPFVKCVFFVQGSCPSIVLYTDQQLIDLKRSCSADTTESLRSVMAVDRTFNLSSLFLTITVFKNRSVTRKNTQEPPVFLGPMFLHGDGKTETYQTFFGHLSQKLANLHSTELRSDTAMITGSDEELALVHALGTAFPSAKHLYCMLHCKGNVRQHLIDIGVSLENRERIVALLFGADGAILSGDEETLDNRLSTVMQFIRCNNLTVSEYMQKHIFPKVRANCRLMWTDTWLGRSAWNNNSAESINHQLKLAVDWKPQRLTDLVAHLHDAVSLQYSNLRRSLFGQGDLQLVPLMCKHYVPFVKWNSLAQEKQDKLFLAFLCDNGVRSVLQTVTSTDGKLTVKGRNRIMRKPNQTSRPKAVRTARGRK